MDKQSSHILSTLKTMIENTHQVYQPVFIKLSSYSPHVRETIEKYIQSKPGYIHKDVIVWIHDDHVMAVRERSV